MENQNQQSDNASPQNDLTERNENSSNVDNAETGTASEVVPPTSDAETGSTAGGAETSESVPATGGRREIQIVIFEPGTDNPRYPITIARDGEVMAVHPPNVAQPTTLGRILPPYITGWYFTEAVSRLQPRHNFVISAQGFGRENERRFARRMRRHDENAIPNNRRSSIHLLYEMARAFPILTASIFVALLAVIGFIIFLVHSVVTGYNTKEDTVTENPDPPRPGNPDMFGRN